MSRFSGLSVAAAGGRRDGATQGGEEVSRIAGGVVRFFLPMTEGSVFERADEFIDHGSEGASDERGDPEQLELLHGPAAGKNGHGRAAGWIYRRIGHRNADQVDQGQTQTNRDWRKPLGGHACRWPRE